MQNQLIGERKLATATEGSVGILARVSETSLKENAEQHFVVHRLKFIGRYLKIRESSLAPPLSAPGTHRFLRNWGGAMTKTKIDAQLQSLITEACEVLKSQSSAARLLGNHLDKGTTEIIDYLDQVAELFADRQAQIVKRMSYLDGLINEVTVPPKSAPAELLADQRDVTEWLELVRRRTNNVGSGVDRVNSAMSSLQTPKRYATAE